MRYGLTADSMAPARDARRPSLVNALFEFRFPVEAAALLWSYAIHQPRPPVDDGNRKIVMMIPGFMAGDLTLAPLAKFCEWLGHKTFFTGIWSNSRCPRDMVQHLERNLEEIHASFGRVVIIGHSLGGMYALELAVRRPDLIERVITLGSPIRSVEDSSHAFVLATAKLISILRGMDHGCLESSSACIMDLVERHPGRVPTTAMYSRTDGVVHWESCVDQSGATTIENVEVTGSHVGMAVNAAVYRVVADRLAMPPREQCRSRYASGEADQ
jgi:triacylglycerol lipase